jgi:hypothetical protein
MKQFTRSEIETLRYMLSIMNDNLKEITVAKEIKKYILTEEFINEFRQYITVEAFSTAPHLSYNIIKKYPLLFNVGVWMSNSDKDLEPLLNIGFCEIYNVNIEAAVKSTKIASLTSDIFLNLIPHLSNETINNIMTKVSFIDNKFIEKNIKLIDHKVLYNKKLNINWSKDLIEKVLQNKQLTARTLIAALSKIEDYSFIKRIIDTDLDYKITGETFDEELGNFVISIHTSLLSSLFNLLRKINPNALSYDVLSKLLKYNNELDSKFLDENESLFIQAGLFNELKNYEDNDLI